MKASQTKHGKAERNDRLLAVPGLPTMPDVPHSIEDMDRKLLNDIAEFFRCYNRLEGKKFKIHGTQGPKAAEKLVKRSAK